MMLVPMYFLIALWGHKASDGKTRITAATKFFIYTQASGLVMLIAILALVFVHYNATGVWTFNYEELLNTPMSHGVEYLLMLGFFIAFAVKCRWCRCMAGCQMRTPRRRPPVPSTWPVSC